MFQCIEIIDHPIAITTKEPQLHGSIPDNIPTPPPSGIQQARDCVPNFHQNMITSHEGSIGNTDITVNAQYNNHSKGIVYHYCYYMNTFFFSFNSISTNKI